MFHYMDIPLLSIHLSVDGYLRSIYFLAIINDAFVNTFVQTFTCMHVFILFAPKTATAGHMVNV